MTTDTQNRLRMKEFQLLGHECVYGGYPGPVIPVGRIGGELVVLYPGGAAGPTAETVEPDSTFVKYPPPLVKKLATFNAHTDRLFAYSDTDVVPYKAAEEREFFIKLLNRSDLQAKNPTVWGLIAARLEELELVRP